MLNFLISYLDKEFISFLLKLLVSGIFVGAISSGITETIKVAFEKSIWKDSNKKLHSIVSLIINIILVIVLSFIFVSLLTTTFETVHKIKANLESIILNSSMVLAISIPASIVCYELIVKNIFNIFNIFGNKIKSREVSSEIELKNIEKNIGGN